MRLRITHDTCYRYAPAVRAALHLAYLTPPHTRRQRRLDARLDIRPEPTTLTHTPDIYDNPRSFFEIAGAHDELRVRASSLIDTQAPDLADSAIAWEQVRDGFVYHAGAAWHPAAEFVYPSVHVHPGAPFAEYAKPSFTPGRPLLDAARELMQRVHQDFEYASASTDIATPATTVMAQRRGVCQDFAHLTIAGLRGLGLAARYVSGYLETLPPPGRPRLVGADVSHAWVSVHVPRVGWLDLDPTNDQFANERHVTVAWGRDYSDVPPLKGVIFTESEKQTLEVTVDVVEVADDDPVLAEVAR